MDCECEPSKVVCCCEVLTRKVAKSFGFHRDGRQGISSSGESQRVRTPHAKIDETRLSKTKSLKKRTFAWFLR